MYTFSTSLSESIIIPYISTVLSTLRQAANLSPTTTHPPPSSSTPPKKKKKKKKKTMAAPP